jgi:hypothetical protein
MQNILRQPMIDTRPRGVGAAGSPIISVIIGDL